MLPAVRTVEAVTLTVGTGDFPSLPLLHWKEQMLSYREDWKRDWVSGQMMVGT